MIPAGPSLITGAAGFIGRRLALRLRGEGVDVRALVRPEHEVDDLVSAGIELFRGDSRDPAAVARAAGGCSVIYHLAAARGRKKLTYREYEAANQELTRAVAEAALEAGARIVVTSTATVTGSRGSVIQTEHTPARPNSAYRRSRLSNERLLEGLRETRGLDFVIVRVPQMVLGPGARDWVRWVRSIRDGGISVLPRGGSLHSGDVEDVIQGLRLSAAASDVAGERFLLGAERPEPVVSLFGAIAEALGVKFRPRLLPALPFRAYTALGNLCFHAFSLELPYHYTCEMVSTPFALDIRRARLRLGYAPRFDMNQSAARTVAWLQEHDLV